MTIRPVTEADAEAIRGLWEAFDAEIPEPPGYQPETWDEAWADLRRHAADGVALIAEDDAGPAGFAFATALRGERSTSPTCTSAPTRAEAGSARA